MVVLKRDGFVTLTDHGQAMQMRRDPWAVPLRRDKDEMICRQCLAGLAADAVVHTQDVGMEVLSGRDCVHLRLIVCLRRIRI